MTLLRVQHLTRYVYCDHVGFGAHKMMLRPRNSSCQTVLDFRVSISPAPASCQTTLDAFGNEICIAQFEGTESELTFASQATLVHTPTCLQPRYEAHSSAKRTGHALFTPPIPTDYQHRPSNGGDDVVLDWIISLASGSLSQDLLQLFMTATRAIYRDFAYALRLEEGRQSAQETLAIRRGSCRDFAVLMIEAARRLGCAARFCSGYSFSLDALSGRHQRGGGHTHAWASIFLPDYGWVAFDPTHGSVGDAGLILVAMTSDPSDACPITGAYFGEAKHFMRMDVDVVVEAQIDDQAERWVA